MKFKAGDRVTYRAIVLPIPRNGDRWRGTRIWHGTVVQRVSHDVEDAVRYEVDFDGYGLMIRRQDDLEFESGLERAVAKVK